MPRILIKEEVSSSEMKQVAWCAMPCGKGWMYLLCMTLMLIHLNVWMSRTNKSSSARPSELRPPMTTMCFKPTIVAVWLRLASMISPRPMCARHSKVSTSKEIKSLRQFLWWGRNFDFANPCCCSLVRISPPKRSNFDFLLISTALWLYRCEKLSLSAIYLLKRSSLSCYFYFAWRMSGLF